MVKRLWLIGLLSLVLVGFLEFSVRGADVAVPLESMMGSFGLPMMEQSPGQALKPGNSVGPTDFQVTFAGAIAQSAPNYAPREETALADPTNYGDRFATDVYGRPVYNDFIAVLHETVGSAQSAINTFRTPHPRDDDQVSYHALIARDGTVIYIVPPEKRAFGAGNSVFNGPQGPETVLTNPQFPPSVNNSAYHVSLETPSDGRGNSRTHSGYTQAQYESLAWLLARTTIPENRITTHRIVDRSGNRMDPRSFDTTKFLALLRRYPSRAGLASSELAERSLELAQQEGGLSPSRSRF
ncbi:MAG: N-acetylmuramoyl-L-alanine amidase [Cyanobacteria bacterium Co-bin8]|nr:N-acetylmuramoyl-L-alanine amidase [Cyanobacteria bacterium Co-bin8]